MKQSRRKSGDCWLEVTFRGGRPRAAYLQLPGSGHSVRFALAGITPRSLSHTTSVGEVAKLLVKPRATIDHGISAGKLTAEKDEDSNWRISTISVLAMAAKLGVTLPDWWRINKCPRYRSPFPRRDTNQNKGSNDSMELGFGKMPISGSTPPPLRPSPAMRPFGRRAVGRIVRGAGRHRAWPVTGCAVQ